MALCSIVYHKKGGHDSIYRHFRQFGITFILEKMSRKLGGRGCWGFGLLIGRVIERGLWRGGNEGWKRGKVAEGRRTIVIGRLEFLHGDINKGVAEVGKTDFH